MSQYREAILTDKGLDFARKAANGLIKITFTKGVFSADQHQSDSEQALQGLTTLSSFLQSDPINYVSPTDDANVNVPLRFRNNNLQADGVINTVGLYASDGTNEILYSVIINDAPETFQAYNGKTPESVKINYETQVGRAEQVSVQVSPLGTVTEEEFSAAVLPLEQSSSHASDVSSLSTQISSVAIVSSSQSSSLANEISSNATNIGSNTTSINNLSNIAHYNRGKWTQSILALNGQADGDYSIYQNTTDAPQGFTGYGVATVRHDSTNDTYITLQDNTNNEWHNHYGYGMWNGWTKTTNPNDTNYIFQARGVLSGYLLNVVGLEDGYYQLIGNGNGGPSGFNGYGIYIKQHFGEDNYVTIIQSNNTIWQAHEYSGTWDSWVRLANENDLTTAWNAINAIKSKLGMS